MPLRAQIPTACQFCRKKRAKCDGETPCQRCKEAGEVCEYSHRRHTSKDELRAEIARLKEALALCQDLPVSRSVSRAPTEGNKSHKSVEGVGESVNSGAGTPQPSVSQQVSQAASTTSWTGQSIGLHCFDQLLSWRSCGPGPSLAERLRQSTILTLPPLPIDAYASEPPTDIWTDTGWTRAHIRHLFDVLRTWDYLPFCLIHRDSFLQDFHNGSDRFCSVALVHAILALSTRLVNEYGDSSDVLPTGWVGSKYFYERAQALLRDNKQIISLPDVQALGILSLYHMRCGRETEAQGLAEVFANTIAELCQRVTAKEDGQYVRARATTYCGAVSLTRMLSLTTGRIFNVPNHSAQESIILQARVSYTIEDIYQEGDSPRLNFATDASGPRLDLQLLAAKIFQLTELVHGLIISTRSNTQGPSSDLAEVYRKCLDWYDRLFSLFNSDSIRTPFVLFIHMYYHFCLLCAFRPFVSLAVEDSDVWPRQMCVQAAQSILALAQSYDDLFTLRRVSGFIPYFVCASALFCLAIEDNGSRIDTGHRRLQDNAPQIIQPEPRKHGKYRDGGSSFAAQVRMSAAAHARQLLSKMGSTHPAATVAEKILGEEIGFAPANRALKVARLHGHGT